MLKRLAACACLLFIGCVPGDNLPRLQLSNTLFFVEIVDTPAARATGLMHRVKLPADHGMLFIFEREAPVAFWMKNTLIPLDILYFNSEQELLEIHANTPPCEADPCPNYPSQEPIKYVLELPAGTTATIDAKLGNKFELIQ